MRALVEQWVWFVERTSPGRCGTCSSGFPSLSGVAHGKARSAAATSQPRTDRAARPRARAKPASRARSPDPPARELARGTPRRRVAYMYRTPRLGRRRRSSDAGGGSCSGTGANTRYNSRKIAPNDLRPSIEGWRRRPARRSRCTAVLQRGGDSIRGRRAVHDHRRLGPDRE